MQTQKGTMIKFIYETGAIVNCYSTRTKTTQLSKQTINETVNALRTLTSILKKNEPEEYLERLKKLYLRTVRNAAGDAVQLSDRWYVIFIELVKILGEDPSWRKFGDLFYCFDLVKEAAGQDFTYKLQEKMEQSLTNYIVIKYRSYIITNGWKHFVQFVKKVEETDHLMEVAALLKRFKGIINYSGHLLFSVMLFLCLYFYFILNVPHI